MKTVWMWVALALLFTGCARPTVVPRDGRKYTVEHRSEERFVYVEYHWKGGGFSDAVALEEAFVRWADKEGILVYAMGRYPTSKQWQLGFVASKAPEVSEFQGRKISVMTLPEGEWAVLRTVDNTNHLFFYWKKFAKWLEADGHPVEKPVYEVYPNILETPLEDETSRGEIRYALDSASNSQP